MHIAIVLVPSGPNCEQHDALSKMIIHSSSLELSLHLEICPWVDRDGRWAARLGAFLVHLVTIDTGTEQREDAAPLSW